MNKDINKDNNLIIFNELTKSNISKQDIYKYIEENNFEKIEHGICIKKDELADYLFILFKKILHLVFSNEAALYHYGLIDHGPSKINVTIYTGYNTSRLTKRGIKIFTVKKELVDLGRTFITDEFNNIIPIYDLERTICDLIKIGHILKLKILRML